MQTTQLLGWVSSAVGLALSFALLGVALFRVRLASAPAGWLLAGAAALQVLSTCCSRGLTLYRIRTDMPYEQFEPLMRIQMVGWTCEGVIVTALLVAGFVLLARAAKNAGKPRASATTPGGEW